MSYLIEFIYTKIDAIFILFIPMSPACNLDLGSRGTIIIC